MRRAAERPKTHTSLLLALGVVGTLAATARPEAADLVPSFVINLGGTLHVSQNIPCSNTVTASAPVNGGRFQLSPAEGLDAGGGKEFSLTKATVTFVPFTASGSCLGFSGTQTYSAIGVELAKAVTFVANPLGAGSYSVTIPKDAVEFWEGSIVNGSPENGYLQPAEDITGTIDLAHGTASLHVVVSTSVHFKEGCLGDACIIDETDGGTLTTDVSGTIAFPDADGDGVPDRTDNCRFVANPSQTPVATPTITAPTNVTLASCADRRFGFASAADVCDGGPVTVSNNAPVPFLTGTNTVTWTAVDQKNRAATADQTVTVIDTTPPMFSSVPPDVTVHTCGPVSLGRPTGTDDCAGTVTFSNDAPGYFFVGSTPVTWTATDASGNHATATQTVTVADTTAPSLSCTPVSPQGNSYQVSASDACGAPVTQLGTFVLGNQEIVKIDETGQPGVRFIGTVGNNHVRYFQVGKGQAVITTRDGSGNVTTAVCGR